MSTTYTFDLTDDAGAKTLKLKLTRNFILPNEWVDADPGDNCLIVAGGNVDDSVANQVICHSGPPTNTPMMTLKGFHWDKKPGATGDGVCDGCEPGCSTNWSWMLATVG
jgi:hypothetical protein